MIRRTLLRVIAIQTLLSFFLFFLIQPKAIGYQRGGGGGYSREGQASSGGVFV
jgi:hypothetical protein